MPDISAFFCQKTTIPRLGIFKKHDFQDYNLFYFKRATPPGMALLIFSSLILFLRT